MEPLKVAFSFDENFVELFAVTLKSLLDSNREEQLEIFIVYEELSEECRSNIIQIASPYQATLEFVKFDATEFDSLELKDHLNKATYFRLAIPDYLPFSKVLYLDSDLLILGSIRGLWETDLEDSFFAASESTGIWNPLLGLDGLGYCNTGVMLMNLDQWRREDFSKKVVDFLRGQFHLTWYSDQCAINYVSQGNWKRVPLKFNATTDVFMFKIARKDGYYSEQDIENVKKEPVIVHFSGPSKPLKTANRHPYKKIFWRFLSQTPYRRRFPKDFSIVNQVKFYVTEAQRQKIRDILRKFSLLK